MAAVSQALSPETIDLRTLPPGQLHHLLDDEVRSWRRAYFWDYRPSADLVRKFADAQTLRGLALMLDCNPIGYTYFVYDEYKGFIGGLYIREPYDCQQYESLLLRNSIDALAADPVIRRVEAQLLMMRHLPRSATPYFGRLRAVERDFMIRDIPSAPHLQESPLGDEFVVTQWQERDMDETAYLLAAAYQGHIDASINDQYRSPGGARRFLMNMVEYPGCGSFFDIGSLVAWQRDSGRAVGMCLGSRVASDTGHIGQVCVSPGMRGRGIGYELMRRSMGAFGRDGCRRISLTVTAANIGAIQLYLRMGFRRHAGFAAMIWDGF